MLGTALRFFLPSDVPGFAPSLGFADVYLPLPPAASLMGSSLSTQRQSLPGFATSNGLECTIAAAVPALDMALLQGDPLEPEGDVSRPRAHVLKIEFQ
ncbi:MAG: hypothetical protein Fur0037_05470 [Planctomycetota bacterium]